jgi:hypothetical protein
MFWSIDHNGVITCDGHPATYLELQNMPTEIMRCLDEHQEHGDSQFCEICRDARLEDMQGLCDETADDMADYRRAEKHGVGL